MYMHLLVYYFMVLQFDYFVMKMNNWINGDRDTIGRLSIEPTEQTCWYMYVKN